MEWYTGTRNEVNSKIVAGRKAEREVDGLVFVTMTTQFQSRSSLTDRWGQKS